MRITVLAANTCRRSIRNKLLILLFLMSALMVGSSHLFGFFTPEEQMKIVKDMSLAAIAVFGMLMAVLIASGEVATEVDRRTIQTVLSKPVSRHEFIIGKFVGVVLMVALNVAVMTIILFIVISAQHWKFSPVILEAAYFVLLELAVVTSIAMMFSSFSTLLITAVLTFTVYLVGHLVDYIGFLARQSENRVTQFLVHAMYTVLPNLEKFNIRNEVVHELVIPWGRVWKTTGYSLAYTCAFLIIAILIFRKREV